MITCNECGCTFDNLQKLATHIIKHRISSKEYYDKYFKKDGDGICRHCGQETKYVNLHDGYAKWCCRRCKDTDPNFRKKLSNAVKNTYNKELLKIRQHDMKRRWNSGSMDHVRGMLSNMWNSERHL